MASKLLNEIRDALYGFVIINGYLPCPTTIADPSQANYGVAAASCSANPAAEGFLPWKTLGVTETDAWSGKRIVTASPGYWRYRVDRNFANSGVPVTLSTSFSADALTIKDSNGNDLNTASERPLVIVFSTGPNLTGDEQNASPNTEVPGIFRSDVPSGNFDDILIWISRPQLFNRMVAAGKLP